MNEDHLKKFISFSSDLLESLDSKPEFGWFFKDYRKQVVDKFYSSPALIQMGMQDKFEHITENDILRIKAYLKFIDKKAVSYGRKFYELVADKKLKSQLINDFKEMKIALKNDDILEFGRRVCLQIENVFNYSLKKMDVHKIISENKENFSDLKTDGVSSGFNYYSNFFSMNNEPIELSRVSFKVKSFLLSILLNYKVYGKAINDLYFLRNIASHRNKLNIDETTNLVGITHDFEKNYSNYIKVLYDVFNGNKALLTI